MPICELIPADRNAAQDQCEPTDRFFNQISQESQDKCVQNHPACDRIIGGKRKKTRRGGRRHKNRKSVGLRRRRYSKKH